jgi:hypothetical protein
VENWARVVARAAEPYGRLWRHEVTLRCAELLGLSSNYGSFALAHAQRAEKLLTEDDDVQRRVRVLQALAAAQHRAGKLAEARQTESRLAKLEEARDKEYLVAAPPLKVVGAGQARNGNRAVVLELFTGVQCPFCEVAYLVFDALRRTYDPRDLLLVQYHIGGPNPLTNPESQARWDYYAKAFPAEVRSTPTHLFNGRFEPAAGGHASHGKKKEDRYVDAKKRYNTSSELIDGVLETSAAPKIAARADRQGDKISIRVEVRDLPAPADTMRLRLVLVEQVVRYVGGNNLRFHHHVARAMPGGVEGVALTQKDSEHVVAIDLQELRERYHQHLDTPAARSHLLPNGYRPLELEKLRLIAFVQDERTKEIVQGCLVEVPAGARK